MAFGAVWYWAGGAGAGACDIFGYPGFEKHSFLPIVHIPLLTKISVLYWYIDRNKLVF